MRILVTCLMILLFALTGWGQHPIPGKRTYTYSPNQIDYYFYWNSTTEQSLDWRRIHGHEKCFVHIVNNSPDTLVLGRVGRTGTPVYWLLSSRVDLVLPNDTVHLEGKLSYRPGPFHQPIIIEYRSSGNINERQLIIESKGTFADQRTISDSDRRKNKAQQEEQAALLKNRYPNGQVKEVKNPHPDHDSIPTHIAYYEDGTIRLKEYKRTGIAKEAFDRNGVLKNTWDDQGQRTEYYANGNKKFQDGKDRYSSTSPFQTFYYENGCIQKEVFLNASIIQLYDSLKCGKLISRTMKDSINYMNNTMYFKDGKIDRLTYYEHPYNGQKVVYTGTFNGYQVLRGTAAYYSWNGSLLFESQIINGERDAMLSAGEKQGYQVNLRDENGKKTGLWIMQKTNDTVPISFPSNVEQTIQDARSFAFTNYEYLHGDTLAKFHFYEDGGLSSYTYLKDRATRIKQGKEISIGYHPNGLVSFKAYELENGLPVGVRYSKTEANQLTGGSRGNWGALFFEKNELVKIRSEYLEPVPFAENGSSGNRYSKGNYCVEKGQFKHFELMNGTIEYYKNNQLVRTEKVVNGVIQGNPRVNLQDNYLRQTALEYDLNFNGWVEKKEINEINTLNLPIAANDVDQFNWQELKQFGQLEALYVNGRSYRLSDYPTTSALMEAIKNGKGNPVQQRRQTWELIPDPGPLPKLPTTVDKDCPTLMDFPDVVPQFPGGMDSLNAWIENNLIYPNTGETVQGRVFVEFVVRIDGSISQVKILRGIDAQCDREVVSLIKRMPNWEPGYYNREPCCSRVRIPINFMDR